MPRPRELVTHGERIAPRNENPVPKSRPQFTLEREFQEMMVRKSLLTIAGALALAACGGGSEDSVSNESAALTKGRPTYSVGGTIVGVSSLPYGDGITLYLEGNYVEAFQTSTGSFTFVRELTKGATYDVRVGGSVAGYDCAVTSGGTGTIERSDVTNVVVTCTLRQLYPIPVQVTGLAAGSTVVIRNNFNSLQLITATADGTYNFPYPQYGATSYYVDVLTQPAAGSCTVPQPSGTVSATMSPVQVVCTP